MSGPGPSPLKRRSPAKASDANPAMVAELSSQLRRLRVLEEDSAVYAEMCATADSRARGVLPRLPVGNSGHQRRWV